MTDVLPLALVLVVAGLGAAVLVAISGLALYRRRSLSYVLVTLAIGALLLRSLLGTVTLGGLLADPTHHVLEHVVDVVVVGLLFAAVYAARRVDPSPTEVAHRDHDE